MSKLEIRNSGYKRTTDKQYSLLTHEMSRVPVEHRSGKSDNATRYWNTLTERLNALGPPYRTVQQWKKVWTDFSRFHSKRGFQSKPKFTKTIKSGAVFHPEMQYENEATEEEKGVETEKNIKETTSSKVAHFLRHEWEDENSESIHSENSNSIDYDDEYSYPDRHSTQNWDTDKAETLIPDESTYDSYNYAPNDDNDDHNINAKIPVNAATVANHSSPPPLKSSNTHLLDQTLYTFQNQMAHQTKLLEHLSQISSTMAGLMERQVRAVEKQTEAMRRQALATEHHTLVMNNFVEMIRDKIPKSNFKPSTSNLSKNSS